MLLQFLCKFSCVGGIMLYFMLQHHFCLSLCCVVLSCVVLCCVVLCLVVLCCVCLVCHVMSRRDVSRILRCVVLS